MGFNTTVVVLNDALDQIKNDKDFGRTLANACVAVWEGRPVDVPAGNHCNAATVIETHHMSNPVVVLVQGNMGRVMSRYAHSEVMLEEERAISMLNVLAAGYGYKLVKKKRG